MRYATAAAFRAALEQRLLTASRERRPPLPWLRKLVTFDRFLARLFTVAPDRWIVKGGVALELRLGDRARTTKDLDLARQDTEEEAAADLAAAQSVDLGDFFVFAVRRTARLNAALEGAAVRYRVAAGLAGRRFEEVTVDVGFGSPLVAPIDLLKGPDLSVSRDSIRSPSPPCPWHSTSPKSSTHTHGPTRISRQAPASKT